MRRYPQYDSCADHKDHTANHAGRERVEHIFDKYCLRSVHRWEARRRRVKGETVCTYTILQSPPPDPLTVILHLRLEQEGLAPNPISARLIRLPPSALWLTAISLPKVSVGAAQHYLSSFLLIRPINPN